MKTIFYLFIVLFMSANFTSCTPTSLTENSTEQSTGGEDGEVEDDEDDDGGN